MALFKRISATLTATANDAVARFENHEAIGAAALERCREGVAAARAAQRRQRAHGEALAGRRDRCAQAVEHWTRRARSADDDAVALDCLKRRHDERTRLQALEAELRSHASDLDGHADEVRRLENTLDAMTRRHEALRSRETLTRADGALAAVGGSGLDDVFDRWETRVDVAEMRTAHAGIDASTDVDDPLEARFLAEEREASLAAELEALRGEGASR